MVITIAEGLLPAVNSVVLLVCMMIIVVVVIENGFIVRL
jgi:hypothetical protein